MEKTSAIVKVTDRKSGKTAYLKCPRFAPSKNLGPWLNQIAHCNPDFTPEEVVTHAVDRMNQSTHYATIRVVDKPWDIEVEYGGTPPEEAAPRETAPKEAPPRETAPGNAPQEKKSRPRKLTFHVHCLADCMTELTFSKGNVTLEEAMAYAQAHIHELDIFYPPKILAALEVVEGSGYLADDPTAAQVVCVDANFTASPATAQCVKFSRPLTDEEGMYFRQCLEAMSDIWPGGNQNVTAYAVEGFNSLSDELGWGVTAELLPHIEPWNSMIAYGRDFEPGLGPVVRIQQE